MIREIRFPQNELDARGLKCPSPLRDLEPIVVFAGPNGGGKTRCRRLVQAVISAANNAVANLPTKLETRSQLASRLADYERASNTHHPKYQAIQQQLVAQDALLAPREALLVYAPTGPKFPEAEQAIFDLTYSNRSILDVRSSAPQQAESTLSAATNAGFEYAYAGIHAVVSVTARHLFNLRHPDLGNLPESVAQAEKAAAFNRIVEALLGTTVGWQVDASGEPGPLLFGRPFNQTEFSDGQKVLLAWAIILHRQSDKLRGAIVLIDEPENHLHPHVCAGALQRLRDDILGPDGQIFLATHSVPLIAWAGTRSLYLVKDGIIGYAGNKVPEVFDHLLGGEGGSDALRLLLSDAERIAFCTFAAECLARPLVAGSRDGDPQETAFANYVRARAASGASFRILDFGAGKGRLAAALRQSFDEVPRSEDAKPIEYLAYTLPDADPELEANIEATAGHVVARRVTDIRELKLDEASRVDLVVLCNVLHEIDVGKWFETFKAIAGVLRPDGYLLVMEDLEPSVGELPHRGGFVILDPLDLRALFGNDAGILEIVMDVPDRYKERLRAVAVPVSAMARATVATLTQALRSARERAMDQIQALRDAAPERDSARLGRLHALYSMLWVNAELSLKAYGSAAGPPAF